MLKLKLHKVWLPDAKSQLIGKDLDAGKDLWQEEKGVTEDEMVGWHHQINQHEFEQVLGDNEGQGSLACCSPWGHKESDTTQQLNNNVNKKIIVTSKIIADGDCSHEIERLLLLGRKVMTNLDSALKSRDITLPAKVHLVKAMVFPVVMYGCESWTVKKAEH